MNGGAVIIKSQSEKTQGDEGACEGGLETLSPALASSLEAPRGPPCPSLRREL